MFSMDTGAAFRKDNARLQDSVNVVLCTLGSLICFNLGLHVSE